MSGLFGTLNIGKSGMFAQQGAINVTSHNISNANTEGYTRQRAELQTTRPYCRPSMQNYAGPGQVGTGVEIAAINRVRDSFLDYQTRVELGVQGQYSSRNKYLSQIENILNEPTDTGLSNLIGKFFDSWQSLSGHAETAEARKVLVEQSQSLANELNHTYNELAQLKHNTQIQIKDDVFTMNSILNQINQVNQEIIQVKIAGQQPNDLMDRRDLLLDRLSEKFGIEITKEQFAGLNVTTSNRAKDYQGSTSPLGGEAPKTPGGEALNLVQTLNPDEVARFAYIQDIKPASGTGVEVGDPGVYEVTYYRNGDTKLDSNKVTINVKINSKEEYERLDEGRVLWTNKAGDAALVNKDNNVSTEDDNNNIYDYSKGGNTVPIDFSNLKLFEPPSGELRGYMSVQKDVDRYEQQLNKLAKGLAYSVNIIHTQDGKEGVNFFVAGKDGDGKNEEGITAQNIAVNKALIENYMNIITGSNAATNKIGEGDGKRALAIAQLRDTLMTIQNINDSSTRKTFFGIGTPDSVFKESKELGGLYTISKNTDGMTLDSYFKDMVGDLGIN